MTYTAVLFDLFDTLVRFDRDRMPEIRVNGRTVRSTAGHLHAVLKAHAPEISLEACHEALVESWREAERLRAIDNREVPARERFDHFFRRLALDPATLAPGLTQTLIDMHRSQLGKAAELPVHHGPLLERLARRYRLAVVSNFDYTPTAVDILEREGVARRFSAIVVSDAVGWRKPKREIFDEALRRLDVGVDEALFVGDRADIDVLGAQRIGMDAAWINPEGAPLPPGITPPRYELRDLADLGAILGV